MNLLTFDLFSFFFFHKHQEDVNLPVDATTPSVTIDLAETRPNTHAAIDSVTPMGGGEIDIDAINARLDPSLSRAISVSSVRSDQQQTTLSELLQPMDADPFDEDQVRWIIYTLYNVYLLQERRKNLYQTHQSAV